MTEFSHKKNKHIQKNEFHSGKIKQASVLYGAMLIGVVLGLGVSIINTRFLSVEDFGKLKFIQQLFDFTATVLTFGLSYSAGRLIARSRNVFFNNLVGATVVIYSLISLICGGAVFLFASRVDMLFEADVAFYIRHVSPLIFISIFAIVIENLFQGSNKIYSLAFFRIAPRIFYISGSLLLILIVQHFNLLIALFLNYGIAGFLTIWMVLSLKPSFGQLKNYLSDIWQENKVNGSHVYVGSLANVATAKLIGVGLGYYADMESVGYYSLALVLTAPLQFIPTVIGTTLFKSFAGRSSISPRAIWAAILPTALTLIGFWLIIERVIIIVYSDKYLAVIPFAKILSVGMTFHGMGGFFNKFLGAHGKGKELRNAAFSMGGVILAGCIVLLPRYGALGGAIVMASSSVVFFLVTLFYYKKFVKIGL